MSAVATVNRRPGLPRILGQLLLLGFLLGLVVVVVYPLLWMAVSSLKTNSEILGSPFALPAHPSAGSYTRALQKGVAGYLMNSVLVTALSVVSTTLFSAWAAYALSRITIPGSRAVLMVIVGGLMLSPTVALIPLVRLLQSWGLYNTYWALILLYTAFRVPFTTFLIRGYMMDLPREVDEAAEIDGATRRQTFWRVILPMSTPILVSAVILQVLFAWNEFLFALIFLSDDSLKTLPVGLATLSSRSTTDFPAVFAGMTTAAVPMVILFFLGQRYFIRGLSEGVGK